jgi:hypothetical protein
MYRTAKLFHDVNKSLVLFTTSESILEVRIRKWMNVHAVTVADWNYVGVLLPPALPKLENPLRNMRCMVVKATLFATPSAIRQPRVCLYQYNV